MHSCMLLSSMRLALPQQQIVHVQLEGYNMGCSRSNHVYRHDPVANAGEPLQVG